MNLGKRDDTANWKRKHKIARFGELTLEEAMDQDKTDNIINGHPQISEPKEYIAIVHSLFYSAF